MNEKKTCVMWIGAHPDDETRVGGTLAKYVSKGHRAVICAVSKAEKGSSEIPPDELTKIRECEMADAAKILGADFYGVLSEADMEVVLTNELIRKIARAIRAVKPDIVLTHWERDYHLDHNTTSQAVTHAVLCACVPRYDPETEAWSPSRLYYSDTMSGLDFEPELWVDISETEEIKLKSFAAHKSQMAWLGRGGADPLEAIRIQDRFRGLQVGCMFAEAFRATKRRGFVHAESGSIRSLSSLL